MKISQSTKRGSLIKRRHGWTLVEMLVAVGTGALLLAATGSFYVFYVRSMDATANYAELDRQSRYALDSMTKRIRQCGGLTNFDSTHLWFTNQNGSLLSFTWDTNAHTLSYVDQGTNDPGSGVLLKYCSYWQANAFMRVPVSNTTMTFASLPVSNNLAKAALAKVIVMDWICKKTNYLTLTDSESIQTAKVILRN